MRGDPKRSGEGIIVVRWSGILISLTILAVSVAVSLVLISGKTASDWPQLLQYVLTNPAILAAIGTLLVFLTIDRFRDLSGRVNDIGRQVYEVRTSLEADVKIAAGSVSDELSAEWDRVRNKLESIKRENPWLDSISQFEIAVNVPTTGAALRNIDQFLASNDPHIAYEILYEAGRRTYEARANGGTAIEGYGNDFEALAVIALTIFYDAYLCEKLLGRAEESAAPYAAVWKARRLLFALLNDQISTSTRLADDIEAELRPTFLRSLLGRLGFRRNILPRSDYSEAIAALAVHDIHMDNLRARKRRPWLAGEQAALPAWASGIVSQALRLLNDVSDPEPGFTTLSSDTTCCTSVLLLETQRLIRVGNAADLLAFTRLMASSRPGLALLQGNGRFRSRSSRRATLRGTTGRTGDRGSSARDGEKPDKWRDAASRESAGRTAGSVSDGPDRV